MDDRLTAPEQVGGYRVVRRIGRGGMSTIYLAEHMHLRRQVALKVLDPELAENATFRQRFVQESQIVAALDHPHIVPVYDAGMSDGLLFIAMRYVEHRDLRALLDEHGPLGCARLRTLLQQIGDALEVAHRFGLVHRDIKPGNVLLATDRHGRDHFYLSDFGITKTTTSSGLTASGQVLGTPDYIAPEQIEGRPVDARSDVYAFAALVHVCLTGHPPFERAHQFAVLLAHLRDEVVPPSRGHPGVPPAIDPVVVRALAKQPGQRYASVAEFVAAALPALDDPVEAATTRAAPTRPGPVAGAPVLLPAPAPQRLGAVTANVRPPPPTPPAPPAAAQRAPRRKRRFALLAALMAAVLIAAVLAVLIPRLTDVPDSTVTADQGASSPSPTPSASPLPPASAPAFVDPQGRFGITPPLGWRPDTGGASATEVIFFSPTSDTTPAGEFTPNINIVVAPGGVDFGQTVENNRRSLRTLPGYASTEDRAVVLGDGTAAHVLGGTFTQSGLKVRNVQLFVSSGGTDFVVTATALAETWANWQRLFLRSFDTFTVKPS